MTEESHLEAAILRLLAERGPGKTICPSEAARAAAASDARTASDEHTASDERTASGELTASEERTAWEPLMEPTRAAALRLVAAKKIVVTQGGKIVDGRTAKGPIRLRLR